ncbi:protein ImuB [Sediminihabitans luteus]|uniref:Protein ImuB n=1 Tax=Sediminihabitans luteus TaxID=1138585 RepID=A0A2M9CRC9_9CELL|nr:DNA polymerase Y family protein [Sediminihabitans luteus]PJJ74388.1 protein ImuB [Sediminihabitans luteus]GIJ00246.1 DNA polymerase [Sediminihabitans luteus]
MTPSIGSTGPSMSTSPSGSPARSAPTRPVAPTRTAVLWVPDWPVLAAMRVADVPAHTPAVILDGHQVVAASATARSQGVRRGMRRRRAQECCPEVALLALDEARDAREFEPVAAAAESVVAGVEIARPGLLLLPAGGPARYHGSETALAEALVARVVERTGDEAQVGVADGILAAVLAARGDRVVAPGGSPAYLAGHPVGELVHAVAGDAAERRAVGDLVDLLGRLGVRSLGALAALPPESVHARFGALGAWAHRLATGADLRPPARRRLEPDVEVFTELDPPAERVDVATFAARRLAEDLHDQLVRRSLSAGRLRITARTEAGDDLDRVWRCGDDAMGGLTPARITERVRWQLEGWLTAASLQVGARTGNLVALGIAAEELTPAGAQQPRLWGTSSGEDHRARRALGRVQGILGGDAVLSVQLQGGRDPRDRVHLVPFGESAPPARDPALPWPGALPSPAPASVLTEPEDVTVLDAAGRPVVVGSRLGMSAPPATVHRADGARPGAVRGWAGPWPVAERWWTAAPRRRVHLQVVLDDGTGLLLAATRGSWAVEAIYD